MVPGRYCRVQIVKERADRMNGDDDDVKWTVDRQSSDWLAGPVNGCWNGAYNSVVQGVVQGD